MLFATLDPTMRNVKLPGFDKAILSDTVGFVSDLPTELIAAFRATLEEVASADLLIHVRDMAHPDHEAQAEDVEDVLSSLGIDGRGRAHPPGSLEQGGPAQPNRIVRLCWPKRSAGPTSCQFRRLAAGASTILREAHRAEALQRGTQIHQIRRRCQGGEPPGLAAFTRRSPRAARRRRCAWSFRSDFRPTIGRAFRRWNPPERAWPGARVLPFRPAEVRRSPALARFRGNVSRTCDWLRAKPLQAQC